MKQYIVLQDIPRDPNIKANLYRLFHRHAVECAKRINRELAEGPTQYLPDNYYGPVELWPLVYIGDGEDDLPG